MKLVAKMCNSRVQELLVPCESPHETKDKCMVIYVFVHVHALINGYIEKCEFANILEINRCNGKHIESNTMWGSSPLENCWCLHS